MIRPGFFFFACPDATLLKYRIEAVLADYPADIGHYERHVFWADEGLSARFWETLILHNLFSHTKAIILRRAHLLQAKDWDALAGPLASFNSATFPLFGLENEYERKGKRLIPQIPAHLSQQPYWSLAQQNNWIWLSPGLNKRTIITFLQDWASTRHLSFDPGALEAISSQLHPDASAIEQELTKIELSLTTDTIPAKAAELVSCAPEIKVFAFLNALQRGTLTQGVWKQALRHESEDNSILFSLLTLLNREIRILWQLCCCEDPKDISSSFIPAKQAFARSIGHNTLIQLFTLTLDIEYGVKSGAYSPGQAIEFLVANLAAAFQQNKTNNTLF